MLIDLNIVPLGRGTHLSHDLGPILRMIDESGLPYRLTPAGTCIEGGWEEVMALVKRCHDHARIGSTHVLTTIRIEDELGASNKLEENIASVEHAAGRKLQHV